MKNSSLYEEGVIANQTTLLSGKSFSLMEELPNMNFAYDITTHTWYHKRIPKVNQSFAKKKKKDLKVGFKIK